MLATGGHSLLSLGCARQSLADRGLIYAVRLSLPGSLARAVIASCQDAGASRNRGASKRSDRADSSRAGARRCHLTSPTRRPGSPMRAMALMNSAAGRVEPVDIDLPPPGPDQVLGTVAACGVCRTDSHVIDGELVGTHIPVIPGHEIVGRVRKKVGVACGGPRDWRLRRHWMARRGLWRMRLGRPGPPGESLPQGAVHGPSRKRRVCRVGVGQRARLCFVAQTVTTMCTWCPRCARALFPLRPSPRRREPGGSAFTALERPPIGRPVARRQGRDVFGFVRPGDEAAKRFAYQLEVDMGRLVGRGAASRAHGALDSRPSRTVPEGAAPIAPGARVACAGIHMSDVPSFRHRLLGVAHRPVSDELDPDDTSGFCSWPRQCRCRPWCSLTRSMQATTPHRRLRSGSLTGAGGAAAKTGICPTPHRGTGTFAESTAAGWKSRSSIDFLPMTTSAKGVAHVAVQESDQHTVPSLCQTLDGGGTELASQRSSNAGALLRAERVPGLAPRGVRSPTGLDAGKSLLCCRIGCSCHYYVEREGLPTS